MSKHFRDPKIQPPNRDSPTESVAVRLGMIRPGAVFNGLRPKPALPLVLSVFAGFALSSSVLRAAATAPASLTPAATAGRTFTVKGIVRKLEPDGRTILIRNDAIPNFMDAMTMPFEAARPAELRGLRPGDLVSFRLHVTDARSWIDGITRLGQSRPPVPPQTAPKPAPAASSRSEAQALMNFPFTNELGRAVRLKDFRGQALAITFFYTRCPIPEFCPRLSQNFEEASRALAAMPDAPTNWHFLSITFDPAHDTPAVLEAYARRYHYDPRHWSFLTGPQRQIDELARLSGMKLQSEDGLIEHNFRTLIIDAAGHLQATFPFGGNLSELLVKEMLQAAAVKENSRDAAVKPAARADRSPGRRPSTP